MKPTAYHEETRRFLVPESHSLVRHNNKKKGEGQKGIIFEYKNISKINHCEIKIVIATW